MSDFPGSVTELVDAVAARFAPNSPANWFITGVTDRGPIDECALVQSVGQAKAIFGDRISSSPLIDSIETYFEEHGGNIYVSRLLGPDAAPATITLKQVSNADVLTATAITPGAWANDVHVISAAGVTNGTFVITVTEGGVTVETSPELADLDAAVAWGSTSDFIRLTKIGGATVDPKPQDVTLTGGDDDADGIDTDAIAAALDRFPPELGPGIVSLPGFTTSTAHRAALAHCQDTKRIARLDGANTATAADLVSAATALRTAEGNRLGSLLAPWDVIPGLAVGTTRTVPPCARAAALFARMLDEGLGTTGDAPAGGRLPALFVEDVTQTYSDDDLKSLNDAGVTVSIKRKDSVILMGNRTLTSAVTDPDWSQLSAATVVAAIANGSQIIGQNYEHLKADVNQHNAFQLKNELESFCKEFFDDGDLYGETFSDAVQITPGVDISGAAATLLAEEAIRVVKGADYVRINVTKTPIG